MSIGNRIREVRDSQGLTVKAFATALSVEDKAIDRGNLSRYENDLINPSYDFFYCMLKVYRVNLNWLIGGIGSMFVDKVDMRQMARVRKVK
jgi:transcriptional regulator with XRE-family HTH domain